MSQQIKMDEDDKEELTDNKDQGDTISVAGETLRDHINTEENLSEKEGVFEEKNLDWNEELSSTNPLSERSMDSLQSKADDHNNKQLLKMLLTIIDESNEELIQLIMDNSKLYVFFPTPCKIKCIYCIKRDSKAEHINFTTFAAKTEKALFSNLRKHYRKEHKIDVDKDLTYICLF